MKLEIEGSLTLEEIRELRKVLIWLRRKRKKQGAKFTYKLENSQPQGTAGRRTYGKIKGFQFQVHRFPHNRSMLRYQMLRKRRD